MDPVQYAIHLIEQGKSYDEVYAHAQQRYGIRPAELEQRILDARENARDLLDKTETLA